MLNFSRMISLPVISVSSGHAIATVKYILFSTQSQKILAIVVVPHKLFSKCKGIDIKDLIITGESSVFVNDEACICPLQNFTKLPHIKRYRIELAEQPVCTHTGSVLGYVRDAIFDFEVGKLEELEVTDGIVQDILEGRKLISLHHGVTLEGSTVIVEDENSIHSKNNNKIL